VFSIVAAGGCCDSRGCAFWTDLSLAHNRSGWQGVCESRDRLLAAKVPNENTRTRCNTIDIDQLANSTPYLLIYSSDF
jgi:hypothetical protein